MAAVTKGNIYVYGIDSGVMTNAVLNSINFDQAFNNTGNVLDENGNVIFERMDDIHTTGSATMVLSGDTTLALNDSVDEFTYDAATYYITDMTVAKTSQGFREVSVSFENLPFA